MEKKLLDHGYLKYIEHMGRDESIIEAARMSTDKGFLGWGPTKKYVRQCDRCMIIEDEPCGGDGDCPMAEPEVPHAYGFPNIERTVSGDEKLLAYLYNNKHHTPFEMASVIFEVQAPIMVFREWHR